MKKRFKSSIGYLVSLSIILIILITSIDMNGFNRGFFENEYEDLQLAQTLAIPQDDLMDATNTLLDYLRGERDDIDVNVTIKGNEREAFNSKEALHMVDVRYLYETMMIVRVVCAIIMVLGFVYLIVKMKQNALYYLAIRFVRASIAFLIVIAFLGVYAYVDFPGFWTNFHQLLFRNDLWQLNPSVDFMINMFPESFFFHMVFRITGFFIIGFFGILALCLFYLKQEMLKNSDQNSIK